MPRPVEFPEAWDRYDDDDSPEIHPNADPPTEDPEDELDERFRNAGDVELDFEAALDDEEPEPEHGDFFEPDEDFDDEEPWCW